MPSRSNEGRRKLCEVFTIGGVGSDTSVGGRMLPAKLRPRSCRSSWRGVGRGSSKGEAAGEGKGWGREGQRSVGSSFVGAEGSPRSTAALGKDAPTSPSGVAGTLGHRTAAWERCLSARGGDRELSTISGRDMGCGCDDCLGAICGR